MFSTLVVKLKQVFMCVANLCVVSNVAVLFLRLWLCFISNTEAQKPRVFFDQRDAGMFITSWGKEKPPEVPLLYSLEVSKTKT